MAAWTQKEEVLLQYLINKKQAHKDTESLSKLLRNKTTEVQYNCKPKPINQLEDMRKGMANISTTVDNIIYCLKQKPFDEMALIALVQGGDKFNDRPMTSGYRIEYTILNMKEEGVIRFNSETNKYCINDDAHVEVLC